jgi:hypothetical protein
VAFIDERDHRLAEEIVATCLPAGGAGRSDRAAVVRLVNLALEQERQYMSLRREFPKDVHKARHALTVLEKDARRAAKLLPTPGRILCEGIARDAAGMKRLWTKPIRRAFKPLGKVEAVLRRKATRDQARALMTEVRRAVRVTDGILGDKAFQAYMDTPS